jgi:hypothetical protein
LKTLLPLLLLLMVSHCFLYCLSSVFLLMLLWKYVSVSTTSSHWLPVLLLLLLLLTSLCYLQGVAMRQALLVVQRPQISGWAVHLLLEVAGAAIGSVGSNISH